MINSHSKISIRRIFIKIHKNNINNNLRAKNRNNLLKCHWIVN
jgi:hypothetical protein